GQPVRAPARHRAAGGRHHGVSPVRRDPQQRRPLLPQLRPVHEPAQRPADRRRLGPGDRAGHGRIGRRRGLARARRCRCADGARPRHRSARSRRRRPGTTAPGRDARHAGLRCDHARGPRRRRTIAAAAVECATAGAAHGERRRSADGDHPPAGDRFVTLAASAERAPGNGSPHAGESGAPSVRPAGAEACPLCGAPLDPRQDWCLRCGAAARTRLAATPNWRAPIASIAVVGALALGVLAAALVKLAGDSGSSPVAATSTVTTTGPAAAVPTTPTSTTPGTPTTGVAGAQSSKTTTPTVTAQPSNAGGIVPPSTVPTITAKLGHNRPATNSTPSQKPTEEPAHQGAKQRSNR